MSARILVVDDQPLNVKVLQAKLSSEYYEVITAEDGDGGLEAMRAERPDLVLLDVMMPGKNGFEVCEEIKADPGLKHIPVIMVTALSESSDRVRGLEAGADDFLTKPINDIALFARVRSLLRIKLALDELRLRDHTSLQLGAVEKDGSAIDSGTGGRILIVEDSPEDAQILTDLLGAENEVVGVAGIDEAMAAVDNEKFDLIVVSLDLDGADGLRLCSQLRSNNPTRHIPQIMLIDPTDTERLVKGLDLGVSDYIYQPIDRNELIARVRSQIRHGRYQDRLRGTFHRSVAMAVTDSLTGLYNRLYFTSHLTTQLERAGEQKKPLAVAMIDIDHFKDVNDIHGHAVGDEVLCELANRLAQVIRARDLLARLGGEEFVVLMSDTDASEAEAVSSRMRRAIADGPFVPAIVEGGLEITVSIGVGEVRGYDDTVEGILNRADVALYEAKRGGRNQVIFSTG